MSVDAAVSKVTAGHLARTAYLYVRQSTLRQVINNTDRPPANTPCANGPSPSVGRRSGS
jgi:hypothetical protein